MFNTRPSAAPQECFHHYAVLPAVKLIQLSLPTSNSQEFLGVKLVETPWTSCHNYETHNSRLVFPLIKILSRKDPNLFTLALLVCLSTIRNPDLKHSVHPIKTWGNYINMVLVCVVINAPSPQKKNLTWAVENTISFSFSIGSLS